MLVTTTNGNDIQKLAEWVTGMKLPIEGVVVEKTGDGVKMLTFFQQKNDHVLQNLMLNVQNAPFDDTATAVNGKPKANVLLTITNDFIESCRNLCSVCDFSLHNMVPLIKKIFSCVPPTHFLH